MSKGKLKNKGITLIALIITIIVMLILTGVTLSITLGDNGIVNKAKEATTQTQLEMDRELLLSAVVGAISKDGTFVKDNIVLPEGFTLNGDIYTSAKGNSFTISENGEIAVAGNGNIGGDIIEDGDGEVVTNPWIERGLSADWAYGKWYVTEYGGKWFYLGEDGSYAQGKKDDCELFRLSSEEAETQLMGAATLNGNEFIANGQWKCVLNEDGTVDHLWYDDTGEYEFLEKLIVADESDYEYNLNGIYLNSAGDRQFVFNNETRIFNMQYKSGDSWNNTSDFGDEYSPYWGFKGIYYLRGNEIQVSEDLNTITYNGITYTKQAN